MSIELCEPTPNHPSNWHVRPNRCDCHPETCCCDDWAIYNGNKRDITMHRKESAQEYADLKNKDESEVDRTLTKTPAVPLLKIKWKYVYHPYGEWQDEKGKHLSSLTGNFKAFLDNKEILVIVAKYRISQNDYGYIPCFVDPETLTFVDVDIEKTFIEIPVP